MPPEPYGAARRPDVPGLDLDAWPERDVLEAEHRELLQCARLFLRASGRPCPHHEYGDERRDRPPHATTSGARTSSTPDDPRKRVETTTTPVRKTSDSREPASRPVRRDRPASAARRGRRRPRRRP